MAALDGLTPAEKAELVCSLSALLCADCEQDVSEDNLKAVIAASGNKVDAFWMPVFASTVEKAGGIEPFCKPPGSGGGGGGGGGGGAAPAEAAPAEKEEEEEVDMGGGMDMFGGEEGGGGGGGDY